MSNERAMTYVRENAGELIAQGKITDECWNCHKRVGADDFEAERHGCLTVGGKTYVGVTCEGYHRVTWR
ncbi:hypothetical protein [Streptomyces sp. OP7]|uniref:hypothetical protein n=1 Tax=Streptomyces sp. OP7 TaxID=3142462 RepID=UPI0032E8BBB9